MKYILPLAAVILMASCSSRKQVVYFQDIDQQSLEKIDSAIQTPVIQINDVLSIQVSALDPQSVEPFSFNASESQILGYIVNTQGEIQFPVIGKIHVLNKSLEEVEEILQDSISNYVHQPIVQAKIVNFKITVLGEVNNPGTYTVTDGSINILQAIGLAGDFSINGRRDNVLLIRQLNGERVIHRINFASSDWMNDAIYYLRQNDMIYVEPNYAEVKSAGLIGDLTEFFRVVTVVTTTYILLKR